MKKSILLALMASLFLFSCKKEHQNVTDTKKYKVNFNVSGFTQSIIHSSDGKLQTNSLAVNDVIASKYVNILYYFVFSANGSQMRSLIQDTTSSNFGNISDSLPAGTYTVVFVAGNNLDIFSTVTSSNFLISPTQFSISQLYFLPSGRNAFFDKFQLTVSGSDINQDVTLSRVEGQLEIQLLDVIPANAKTFTVTVNPEMSTYLLNGSISGSESISYTVTIPDSSIGKTTFKLDHNIANTISPFTVQLSLNDASNKSIAATRIDSVICQPNKRTILSGKILGSSNTFTTGVNDVWNTTPITIPYSGNAGGFTKQQYNKPKENVKYVR